MFAVIETGGKQYLAKAGETLALEKLPGAVGESIVFDKVLLLASEDGSMVEMGTPYLNKVTVKATIMAQARTKKLRVIKYKRKVRYRRAIGHRQFVTKVKIEEVK